MTSSASEPQTSRPSADALGARRYEYRYPASAKLIAAGIVLLIPLVIAAFLRQVIQPESFSDRLVPAFMALILIAASAFLAYRQAYFAWSAITIYERGLRFTFWRTHVVVPWSQVQKFYLTPGRSPRWHLLDADERVLCELRSSARGRACAANGDAASASDPAPSLPDAIIEQAGLILQETPYRHYAPALKGTRKGKKR